MNEKNEFDETAKGMVTPPPFRPQETETSSQEPTASPTLADRAAALGLDENTAQRLIQLTQDMAPEAVNDDVIITLARGITHDEDVQNADAAGYLRGRNEKIEAVLHPKPEEAPDETPPAPVFPRYCRRSIWD